MSQTLAGQYFDAETGLHYNYHRYYDPKIGRYLTPDPIGVVGGMNLYLYGNLNPIINFDRYGLYVGGVGIGTSGSLELKNKLGLSGSAALLYVKDDDGNWGIAACGSGGGALGTGGVVGLQTSHLWSVDTICDLEGGGLSLSGGGGYAAGPGIAGDVGKSGLNVITGAGLGRWGGALNVVGGCKLLYSSKQCDTNQCEQTYYGISKTTGKPVYRKVQRGSNETVYYNLKNRY